MENPRILNWRSWSIVRKAQILGALLGILLTFAIRALDAALAQGDTLISWYMALPYTATIWVPVEVTRIFGWPWPPGGSVNSASCLTLIYLTNALLLAAVGTVFGWLWSIWKRARK